MRTRREFLHLPIRLLLAALVALLAVPDAAAQKDRWSGVERIVAVGDVHGDYDQFVKVLRSAGLINEKEKWVGGRTHLVQTGDVPDRGPHSRKVYDLLMQLEKQAKKAKGYVHTLIGNHEAMNIYGDLRYVHPGEFEAFKTPRSHRVREEFYDRHVEQLKNNPPPEGLPLFGPAYKQKWMEEHPLGWFEHRVAYGPRGDYGKWIMNNNTVIKVNDTLFLHGGISPEYAGLSIREINKQVREELKDFSKLREGMVIDSEGPVWYRGLAQNDPETEVSHLETVLAQHDAKRIVMGHTVTEGTVMPRFGARALFIDVGLSDFYSGRMACLVIEEGTAYTLHRGEKLEIPTDGEPSSLLAYLEKAAALDPEPSPLRAKVVQLHAAVANAN